MSVTMSKRKRNSEGYETEDQSGSKEPMDPDEIRKHEPTAFKRDNNQRKF
jgi:hypothetical protein